MAVSGGFDPLHIGHVRHLQHARQLGDALLILLNSDVWLNRKKRYVVMPWRERREILQALTGVDAVVPVDDTDGTVANGLRLYRPHIFAKGGDRMGLLHLPKQERVALLAIGCQVVFSVGDKVQASSTLIAHARP